MTHLSAIGSGQARDSFSAMRKPKKLWKVGEIARHTGLSRQAVHNYVLLGLIRETERTPSGHRYFDDSVFARLERIEQLKRQGKRLREIAELLDRPKRKKKRREQEQRSEGHGRETGE